MKHHLSPFVQGKDSIWHWKKECENYPTEKNAKVLVTIHFPTDIELCEKCSEIHNYNIEASKKRMTMVVNDRGLFKY